MGAEGQRLTPLGLCKPLRGLLCEWERKVNG
jgi:hypothetical protein